MDRRAAATLGAGVVVLCAGVVTAVGALRGDVGTVVGGASASAMAAGGLLALVAGDGA